MHLGKITQTFKKCVCARAYVHIFLKFCLTSYVQGKGFGILKLFSKFLAHCSFFKKYIGNKSIYQFWLLNFKTCGSEVRLEDEVPSLWGKSKSYKFSLKSIKTQSQWHHIGYDKVYVVSFTMKIKVYLWSSWDLVLWTKASQHNTTF